MQFKFCERDSTFMIGGEVVGQKFYFSYGLETVVSVLFTNTRTRWPHNEREIFNTALGVAECSIENFEFIGLPASACICKQNTN